VICVDLGKRELLGITAASAYRPDGLCLAQITVS